MNRTNFEHAAIALVYGAILAVLYLLLGPSEPVLVASAGVAAVSVFFGREHAQHERLVQKRSPEDAWAWVKALDVREWDLDSLLDLGVPILAVVAAFFFWLVW